MGRPEMPDPRSLYIVTAVVVTGLVAWVIAVLARAPAIVKAPAADAGDKPAPKADPAPPKSAPPPPEPAAKGDGTPKDARTSGVSTKPLLDSHLEIQDEPDGPKKES